MLNNSWKKYGGISNTEQFHNLNIGTLVADQVLLREKVATTTIFNTLLEARGGLTVTSINATNNIDICNNLIVYNDINAKTKLYFSSNNTSNIYFFKRLNTNYLGLNTENALATLHIISGDNTNTDVFRATSLNTSVRSILAENSNKKGITVNSDNTNSYIKFFNANTVEGAADTTFTSTNAGLFTLSSASNILSATGGSSSINSTTTMDVSSNTIMTLRAGTGMRILSNNTFDMSSNSTFKINSNTLLNIVSPTTNIYSNLHVSNRNTVSNIYNETLVVYDNSYGNYLYDAYENSSNKTGNALTMVSDTNTSNTFMNIVTPSKLGLSMGGGSYINDNTRSMGTIGVTNSTGNYLPTQTIISGNTKAKYYTTTGFNTYAPRSEQYLIDINGATHITNGEINKVLDISYEIINMSFSKYNSKYGIASGTPSSYTSQYVQTLNYTIDGGFNWTAVRFDSVASSIENSSKNITISVYDGTYSIIGANNGFSYYTTNGGASWYKFLLPTGQKNIQKVFIQQTTNSSKRIMLAYNTSTAATIPTTTEVIGYFDIALSSLPNSNYSVSTLNTFVPSITTINCIDGYNDYVYLAGAGIQKYQVSILASQYNIKNTNTYNYIHVYDTNYAVAVGVNILSYTRDGTNWTDVVLSSTTLNSVYVYNSQYAVAVGTNGKIYYTKDSNFATWIIVPDDLLNTGGNSVRINGSTNVLRNVHMPDVNTMIISNIKQSYVLSSAYGLSKVYNCYFPNLFNRSQNNVLDVSGTMNVAGDINIVENGNLYVDKNTTLNGNVLINTDILVLGNINTLKNIVSTGDTTMNGKLAILNDASFNSRLVVGNDITTNKRLFAIGDTSLNGNLFVGKDITITGRLNVQNYQNQNIINTTMTNYQLIVSEDISLNGRLCVSSDASINNKLFVAYDTSLNSRLVVGSDITTNTRLIVVGDTSLNSRLVVGNDITTNRRLFSVGDTSLNGNLYVALDTTFNGKFSSNGTFNSLRDISVNTLTMGLGGGGLATNTAIGYQVLKSKTSGNNNTAFGYNALTSNTTGELNTAIGSGAMSIGTTANNCVAIGASTLVNSTGLYNVAVGNGALQFTTTGDNNVAIGYGSIGNGVGGYTNTAIGASSLSATTGNNNVAVGYEAAITQTNVVGTVAIGSQASKVSTVQTTAVGYYALFSNTGGTYNTSIGAETLLNNTSGSNNTSIGYQSLRGSTTSSNHTAVGYQALGSNNTGANNTAVGYQAGYTGTANTTGSNNTFVGYQTQLTGGQWSNSTALGSGATITRSNQVVLGTASEKIFVPGSVGIGTTAPSTALQVVGTTTSTTFNATSDYRIKTNVVSLQDTSITLDNLRPVMYTNLLSNKEDIGFIAHEVQEHFPFLVAGEKDGEHNQSINYNGMIGILTKEIQELKKDNRSLHHRLALLESKLL